MYRISDVRCVQKMMVKNVKGTIDENNRASLCWDWPDLAEIKYCIVFTVEEDISLEEILHRGIVGAVYEETFGIIRHTAEIEKSSIQFKVYPARKLPNRDYEIINQMKDNCSNVFYKKIYITYDINYRTVRFSAVKTAVLRINGISELNEDYIIYRCIGGVNSHIKYPIDIKKFGIQGSYEIHLSRREEIILELTENQKKYITLLKN